MNEIGRWGIKYRLRSILATMQHCHMKLYYKDGDEPFQNKWMGLDFIWVKEGLILCLADSRYKAYLGNVVTAINGYSIDEIVKKFAAINCNETGAGRKNCVFGLCASELKYLGIMKPEDH